MTFAGAAAQVPVFVWAPEEEGQFQPGRCSRWWLQKSLQALEGDLRALGSSLIYRCAPESRTALLQLVQETGAQVPPTVFYIYQKFIQSCAPGSSLVYGCAPESRTGAAAAGSRDRRPGAHLGPSHGWVVYRGTS